MSLPSPSTSNADPKIQTSPIISRNIQHIPEDLSHKYKEVPISRVLRRTAKSSSRKLRLPTTCTSSDPTNFIPTPYIRPDESSKGNMFILAKEEEGSAGTSPGKTSRRPPNGFLKFRSQFLKDGRIPKNVEKRQHILSQVVGHAWNAMTDEERQVWLDEAKCATDEYKKSNPLDCQTPSPRTPRTRKNKGKETREDTDKKVEEIRKTYLNIPGPAPLSPRKKKEQERRARRRHSSPMTRNRDAPDGALQAAFDYSSAPTSPQKFEETPQLRYHSPPDDTDAPQERSVSLPRRPSTSLGFTESAKMGLELYFPGQTPAMFYPDFTKMQAFTLGNVPKTPTRNRSYLSQPFTPRSTSSPFSTPMPHQDSPSPSTPQRHIIVNGAQMIPNMYGSYNAMSMFNPPESPTTTVMSSPYKISPLGLAELEPSRTSVPFLDPASLQHMDPSLSSKGGVWTDSPFEPDAIRGWAPGHQYVDPESPYQPRRQHLPEYGTGDHCP